MSIVTPAQIKEHVQTDLVDAAIQRLLDDADAEIIRRLGPAATQVDMRDGRRMTSSYSMTAIRSSGSRTGRIRRALGAAL